MNGKPAITDTITFGGKPSLGIHRTPLTKNSYNEASAEARGAENANDDSTSPAFCTFTNNIQKWVVLDKQLTYVNEKARQIRETKQAITTDICQYIQQKQWTTRPIEIADGVLKFVEKREYSPLSFSYIEECLDELIKDKEQIDYMIQYLKDHRELKTTCELRRTPAGQLKRSTTRSKRGSRSNRRWVTTEGE